jgi:hypothetical protein
MAAAQAHHMPLRGERSAPIFDQKQPNDLGRYFKQLEILFARCAINVDADMKEYASSYVTSEVADSWEAIPEFSDAAKTFVQFRDRLFEIYNQVSLRYILADVDRLIGERQRLGIRTLQDLSEFHLRFNAISGYLIANQLLSSREQSQCYLRVFDESLQSRIVMRLQIKLPNHHPSLPYTIDEVYDAAKWVLQGVPASLGMPLAVTTPALAPASTASTPAPDAGFIKQEQMSSFLTNLSKTIADAITPNRPRPYPAAGGPMAQKSNKCMFDGGDHFIRDCPGVDEYIKQGKCRRNYEGKVVLSTGTFVPRDIPGEFLRDRIDEWHRRNPNQLAAGILSSNTTLFNAVAPSATPVKPTVPILQNTNHSCLLSAQDRIAALESELFNLRVRHQPKFVPTIKTRSQRAAENDTETNDEPTDDTQQHHSTPEPVPTTEEPVYRRSTSPTDTSPAKDAAPHITEPSRVSLPPMPEHPFRHAKDATYIPPQIRNIGAPSKLPQPVPKKSEAAYRTLPAIHDPTIANKVYNRALETPFTVTYHELLSLSPEVRSQVRDAVSSKRVVSSNPAPVIPTQATMLRDESLSELEMSYLFPDEEVLPYYPKSDPDFVMALNATTAAFNRQEIPDEAIVVDDPYDRYYRTLPAGEQPDPGRLVVAKESLALRSIMPLVDNQLKVEAILDPGCQIIAMSEDVCHELALPYDPTIVLHMQSANGAIDPSLGLARNVPFLIGPLTFYMQVHVIRKPAYDILLGRPFDVLTESVVRNFRNEDQTITVHDPNTRRVATIPTICRGPPRILAKKKAVFHE